MIIKPIKTRMFRENENIFEFIKENIRKLSEKSVVVITSKIVALSEGRVSKKSDVKTKEKLIKKESRMAIKTKWAWLTIKDGQMMASAGIDESNANGALILLPKNSFQFASYVRKKLLENYKIKKLGVLITDSRTIPLRSGVIGSAIGYAGFKGIRNYVGKPDIFGRKFKFSKTNIADGLAAAAVLCMGEGREQIPLVVIQNVPIEFTSQKINKKETQINIKNDMYRPMFLKIKK